MGVSAGYPDISIPYVTKIYYGLYIEFKRPDGGVISQPQKEWLDFLNRQGYHAEVAYGFDHAIKIFASYFS